MDTIVEKDLMAQIAELKRDSIRNAKSIFDALIAQYVEAAIVDMIDGTILYATASAHKLFGYVNGELDGKNIKVLMPERFRKSHDGHLVNFAHSPKQRGMGAAAMDLFGLTKQGEEFRIEISLYPVEAIGRQCVVVTFMRTRQ